MHGGSDTHSRKQLAKRGWTAIYVGAAGAFLVLYKQNEYSKKRNAKRRAERDRPLHSNKLSGGEVYE